MTCDEFKQQVAAYALGALDAAERAACDQHLGETKHEGCLESLRAASESALLLAESLPPAAPAPSTWSTIESRIRGAAPARRRTSLIPWLVAAAAILVILALSFDRRSLEDNLQASRSQLQSEQHDKQLCVAQLERMKNDAQLRRDALALLGLPGTRLIGLTQSGGTAQANVIYHPGEKRAYLLGRNLAAPSGKDYQLWMIRGDKKIPAGLLHADATGALVSAVDPALLAEGPPDAMAVTLEAAGGRPQPEGPIVLVGKI